MGRNPTGTSLKDRLPAVFRVFGGLRPPVNLVCPPLEGFREAPEGRLEHSAHQHRKHTALELVGDEELDLARALARRVEIPAILHPAERAVQVLDKNLQVWPVE